MRVIFFGPPGSGKGTQAKLVADKYKITHISTGHILREKLNDEDKLSLKLRDIMSSGNLVVDDILNKIIAQKLLNNECKSGFILDGFPRTIPQSEFLLSFLKINNIDINFIFNFKIDFKVVEERILIRSKEEKRSDDNLDVIKTRLNKYMEETHPVSKFFREKYSSNYFTIDADQKISQIQKELIKVLKKGEN